MMIIIQILVRLLYLTAVLTVINVGLSYRVKWIQAGRRYEADDEKRKRLHVAWLNLRYKMDHELGDILYFNFVLAMVYIAIALFGGLSTFTSETRVRTRLLIPHGSSIAFSASALPEGTYRVGAPNNNGLIRYTVWVVEDDGKEFDEIFVPSSATVRDSEGTQPKIENEVNYWVPDPNPPLWKRVIFFVGTNEWGGRVTSTTLYIPPGSTFFLGQ